MVNEESKKLAEGMTKLFKSLKDKRQEKEMRESFNILGAIPVQLPFFNSITFKLQTHLMGVKKADMWQMIPIGWKPIQDLSYDFITQLGDGTVSKTIILNAAKHSLKEFPYPLQKAIVNNRMNPYMLSNTILFFDDEAIFKRAETAYLHTIPQNVLIGTVASFNKNDPSRARLSLVYVFADEYGNIYPRWFSETNLTVEQFNKQMLRLLNTVIHMKNIKRVQVMGITDISNLMENQFSFVIPTALKSSLSMGMNLNTVLLPFHKEIYRRLDSGIDYAGKKLIMFPDRSFYELAERNIFAEGDQLRTFDRKFITNVIQKEASTVKMLKTGLLSAREDIKQIAFNLEKMTVDSSKVSALSEVVNKLKSLAESHNSKKISTGLSRLNLEKYGVDQTRIENVRRKLLEKK